MTLLHWFSRYGAGLSFTPADPEEAPDLKPITGNSGSGETCCAPNLRHSCTWASVLHKLDAMPSSFLCQVWIFCAIRSSMRTAWFRTFLGFKGNLRFMGKAYCNSAQGSRACGGIVRGSCSLRPVLLAEPQLLACCAFC